MKKTVFFCIGLTISASLFAATGSNTKKTSKAKTTVTKTASTKKSASTSKNANAKKETKDKKNTETKKNTGSKTESKKGTVNSKNSKSNTTKNKDTSSKETKKSTVSTKSTKTTKETKTVSTRSRKAETAKPKRTAGVVAASSSWEETKNAAEVTVEKEKASQGSVMVTNLNTIYQNKEENLNVNSKNKAVADTFEKVIEEREKYTHFQTGMASYYGGSWHGKKTANGEIFNENSLTAAHKTLPFGTKVKVTNLDNGKSVVVRINNRGPYSKGRVIDLSKAAFSKIASTSKGVTRVKLEVAK